MDYEGLSKEVEYDPLTGFFVWITSTIGHKVGDKAGGLTPNGYIRVSFNHCKHMAHRLAYFIMTGSIPDLVDHENGIKHDNRWSNIRAASSVTNAWNTKTHKNKKTAKAKGVRKQKDPKLTKPWQARIQANGKREYLGSFETEKEASVAYEKRAKELFGEFYNKNGGNI